VIEIEVYETRLKNEKKLHTITRNENNERLANKHNVIKNAESIELLEPFAKAYLGLFLEIDSTFSPEQRIRFIASNELANAAIQGLSHVIKLNNFPTAAEIGRVMVDDVRLEFGYVILVSMDLAVKNHTLPKEAFAKLSPQALTAALCFNYANSCDFRNSWLNKLIEYSRDLVTLSLRQFWMVQMGKGVRFLPGLSEQLKTKQGQQLVGDIILPILSSWSGYKKNTLNVLLAIALKYSDKRAFLEIIENILLTNKTMNRKNANGMANQCLYSKARCILATNDGLYLPFKRKIIALLDFSTALLDEITLELEVITKIIRLIAPKFPPHIDDFGPLAVNPQKTLRLFYELADREQSIIDEVDWLRSARVMRIVSPILDEVVQISKDKRVTFPSFDYFLSNFISNGQLKEKRSRFKNKL